MAHATRTNRAHHHAMGDCVLFLAAGIAVLVTLLAWATVRALRPGYWLLPAWWTQIATSTPWRGPPPWHWPRIHLCVIRSRPTACVVTTTVHAPRRRAPHP